MFEMEYILDRMCALFVAALLVHWCTSSLPPISYFFSLSSASFPLSHLLPPFLLTSINQFFSYFPPAPSPFLTSASSAGYHCTLTQTITSSSRTMISGSDQPHPPSAIPPPPVCRFVITGVGFGIIDALFPPREVAGSGVVGIVCVCAVLYVCVSNTYIDIYIYMHRCVCVCLYVLS